MSNQDLQDASYDRHEAVTAFRDYFHFLVSMYLNPSDVKEPPEGGWPSITPEKVRMLGKSEEVADLLRHLPYIGDGMKRQTSAFAHCEFFIWPKFFESTAFESEDMQIIQEAREITEDIEYLDDIPEDVIGLSLTAGDGEKIMLDTKLGVIYWLNCPDEIRYVDGEVGFDVNGIKDDPYDWAPEREAEWREASGVWTIPDFFEMLKEKFTGLTFVPVGPCLVRSVLTEAPGLGDGLAVARDIFHQHGWPDLDVYKKRECLRTIQDLFRARYPIWGDKHDTE